MNDKKNKNLKSNVDTLNTNKGEKPWYKKKSTIISSSSILGAGVLAVAIAVPLTIIKPWNSSSTTVNDTPTNLTGIQNAINNDPTKTKSMSYWNSFALNFAKSNIELITADLQKDPNSSFILTFLRDHAAPSDPTELILFNAELKTIKDRSKLIPPSTTLPEGFILNSLPFISTPSNSNLLFDIRETGDPSKTLLSLSLDIKSFSYDLVFNNNLVTLIPHLTLTGELTRYSNASPKIYTIPEAKYDFSALFNSSRNNSILDFFDSLIKDPSNPISTFTNSLVRLNSKTIDKRIAFWNDFNNNANTKSEILKVLKTGSVLRSFILNNIDFANNLSGFGGTFPGLGGQFFPTLNESIKNLSKADLTFRSDGVPGIVFNNIGNGLNPENPYTITIYFGYETDSIYDINFISSNSGNSNVVFKQKLGAIKFDSLLSVKEAASKRVSVLFETQSTAHVFYFKQDLNTSLPPVNGVLEQRTTPITIPSSILTLTTGFINAIKSI